MEIKKVSLTDEVVEQLIELSKIWEQEDITFGLKANTKEDLKEPCYVCYIDNKIVGYTFGHFYTNEKIVEPIKQGEYCFDVDEIYVLKQYRNHGIGKMLYNALEEEVKKSTKWITLPTSTKDYKKILKFYNEDVNMTFHSAFLFKEVK